MPIRRSTRHNPNEAIVLDPRKALATVEIITNFDDWLEDADGHNGLDRKRAALRFKRKFAKAHSPTEAMLMHFEDLGVGRIAKKAGLRRLGGAMESYDDNGALSASFGIDSLADIRRLRALFDRDGRSYQFVDYGEASGLTLLPQGVSGPILRTDSSPYQRGTDLDEWIEDNTAKPARKAPKRRTAR